MKNDLVRLMKAGCAGLVVTTTEEIRAMSEIRGAAEERQRRLLVWNMTVGCLEPGATDGEFAPLPDTPAPCVEDPGGVLAKIAPLKGVVVVLQDFHPYLDQPAWVRRLRDVIAAFRADSSTLVMLGPVEKIPPEIKSEVTVVPFSLPDVGMLGTVLDGVIAPLKKVTLSEEQRQRVLEAGSGLTTTEFQTAVALSLVDTKARDGKASVDAGIVTRFKIEALKKGGVLEFYPKTEGMDSIGGLAELKAWLRKRARAFSPEAKEYGLPSPKGILLVGMPGTGKSLSAKATAGIWGLPLLRLDVGALFGSLVGDTEQRTRELFVILKAMAPCILWIDEIEKALAGSGGGQYDSGVGKRLFGAILTWMSENTAPIFVIATANDVSSLPPELLRKGRFDEIFCVDLPNPGERETIFGIHLGKRGRKPGDFDLTAAVAATQGFSGAEIEAVVVASLFDAFDAGREVSALDLEAAARSTTPLSKSMKTQLEGMRTWAATYARPASARIAGTASSVPTGARNVEV